jgi:hypothetical protein
MDNDNIKLRLEVLHDAFQTTLRSDVTVACGSYLNVYGGTEDTPHLTCRVCLLGSVLLAKVMGPAGALERDLNDLTVPSNLGPIFGTETLAVAEGMFEGYAVSGEYQIYWGYSPPNHELRALMARVHRRWPLSAERARAILNHLIEHEGKFDLKVLDQHFTELDTQSLSQAAKAVLHRYGITPYMEKKDV